MLGKKFILTAALILAGTNAAHAGWVYQPQEDAFSDKVTHMAVGLASPYGAGFRCTDADDLVLIYMTPETADTDTIKTLSMLQPFMLVRVDSGEVRKLPATIELASDDTIIASADAKEVAAVAKDAAGAQRRIAVALEIMGQRMHQKDVDVRGSTAAIGSLLDACGIEKAP